MANQGSLSGVRLAAQLGAAAVLIAALAYGVFARFVREPAEPAKPAVEHAQAALAPAAPLPAKPHPAEAVVVDIKGDVERTTLAGRWLAVRAGDRVKVNETLRTGRQSKAQLEVDVDSNITLAELSEVNVRELGLNGYSFRLNRGRIAADYKPEGERILRIEGPGNQAVAETVSAAKFSVLSTGGVLSVATVQGSVNLKAAGATVQVREGEQTAAEAGRAPAPPQQIPVEVVLRVSAAAVEARSGGTCSVRGQAEPGAEVRVGGELVQVNSEGRFIVAVSRQKGRAGIPVVTRDASGRSREELIRCADQSAKDPELRDFAIRWHKKGQ